MNYFDTSFLVPFFVEEPTSGRIEQFLRRQPAGEPTISQWTRVEFFSAVARQVRTGSMHAETALTVQSAFDALVAESFATISPVATDFDLATKLIRRHETGLRAGDALHLAIATNHGATAIYSLDRGLLKAGQLLDLPVRSGVRLP